MAKGSAMGGVAGRAGSMLSENWQLISVLLLILAQFFVFTNIFPLVGSIDEVSETLDGIAIHSYAADALASGRITNPIAYFQDFQDHTFGLGLKSRPPYFRVFEAGVFTLTLPSIENARIASLLHALLFFAAWFIIVSRFYGKKVALASSLLLLASFSFMEYSWRVYTEFAYLFFSLLAVYFFHLYLEKKSNQNVLLLFGTLLLALMSKEVAIALFPAFAFMFLAKIDYSKGVKGAKSAFLRLFENKWFIPAAVVTAAVSVPWYVLKASTPLFAHLAAAKPFGIETLFYYPIALIANEPVLTLCFIAFLALLVLKRAKPNEFDYALLSLFAGFFLLATAASNKEFRYVFVAYPVFALFAARLAFEVKEIAKYSTAVFAVILLAQLIISYGMVQSYPQVHSEQWRTVALFAESKGGMHVLYAGGPSNYWLSYYISKKGEWKENYLARLYPTVMQPVGVDEASPAFAGAMMDYYKLNYILVDSESSEGAVQEQIVKQAKESGKFEKVWEEGSVSIYGRK